GPGDVFPAGGRHGGRAGELEGAAPGARVDQAGCGAAAGCGAGGGAVGAGTARCRRSSRDNRHATLWSVLHHNQAARAGEEAASAFGPGFGGGADPGAGAVSVIPSDRAASEELTRRIAAIADDKKATELVALDVRELVSYTDFLLIATARNERQAKAIHDE